MIAEPFPTLPLTPPLRTLSFCEEVRLRFNTTYPELASLGSLEGKHLRLELAACGGEWKSLGDPDREAIFRGALAIQMAHEASLFHDDIIDQGKIRRGRTTIFCEKGPVASLILGDQFLTIAYREAAATGSTDFFRLFSGGVAGVVSGEILQNANRQKIIGLPLYQKIISMKTGELFALSLALSRILEQDPAASEIFDLGNRIGCLYQMLDDFLDYARCGDSGKKPYADYESGVWTFVASEIDGFEFGWDRNRLEEKLSADHCRALDRALSHIQHEAHSLREQVRCRFGQASPLEKIISDWNSRAEKAFGAEKSHFLLRATLKRHFPAGNDFSFFTRNSRSFSFASLFFPKAIREKITRLYAFCRITDDLADGELGLRSDERPGVLEAWQAMARRSYHGEPSGIDVLDLAMGDMREGKVPFRYAEELVAGALMDQSPKPFSSRADLGVYTYRVASVVGLWITELSGCHDPEILAEAARLGHAMQLTNILRDVGEDLRAGRIYLPEDLFREFDLRSHYLRDFSSQPVHPVYAQAVEACLCEAEAEYDRAFPAITSLPPAFQIPVAMAAEIYRGIHDEIRKNGYDHFTHRARVSLPRKLGLAARAVIKLYKLKLFRPEWKNA